jgi:hypothetical protein
MGFPFPFSPSVHPRPSISPTPEQFALMQAASPITNVHKVKAATLILMGEEDRRVPPSQTKVGRIFSDRSNMHECFTDADLCVMRVLMSRRGITRCALERPRSSTSTLLLPRQTRGRPSWRWSV